jgi:hypothetical protein
LPWRRVVVLGFKPPFPNGNVIIRGRLRSMTNVPILLHALLLGMHFFPTIKGTLVELTTQLRGSMFDASNISEHFIIIGEECIDLLFGVGIAVCDQDAVPPPYENVGKRQVNGYGHT